MNTKSDTKRTDAAMLRADDIESGGTFDAVHVDVSRQLERELNAATQAIRDIYANEYNSLETYSICEKILPKEEHLKP